MAMFRRDKRHYFVFSIVGLLLVIIGIYLGINHTYSRVVVKANRTIVPQSTPTPTPDPLRPYALLLLGYGGGNHDGGLLTDSMIVAKIEPKLAKATLISLPRDLWVQIPIGNSEPFYGKINSAYAVGGDSRHYPHKSPEFTGKAGGGEMAKFVVGQVVGFPIDYFVAVDFQGFVKVIDLLGGIQVPVGKTFDDPLYPIEADIIDDCGKSPEEVAAVTATLSGLKLEEQFPCRYENLHFEKGTQLMDGATSLKYARSRHSPTDGGDFNRAARQRILLDAVKSRVINVGFIPKIIPTIRTLSAHLTTDIDFARMEEFMAQSSTLARYQISAVALTDQNVLGQGKSTDGQFILIPTAGQDNYTQVHQFILDPTILTPTPRPKPTNSL